MDLNDSRTAASTASPVRARKTRSRPKAEQRQAAMTAILDVAEKLFAEHGREGVTLRAIATASHIDTSLVHYYFDDLEGVFRAVLLRKSEQINAVRNKAMDEYLAAHGKRPTIDGAFEVFLRPAFETIAGDIGYWGHYAAIVSSINSSRAHSRNYMNDAFNSTVDRFIDLLMRLAPNVPKARIYWFYHLLSGSLTLSFAQTGRVDVLSRGACKSTDLSAILDPILQVYTSGFKDLCRRHARAPRKGAARAVSARRA